jgi:hypothetical protein
LNLTVNEEIIDEIKAKVKIFTQMEIHETPLRNFYSEEIN